MFLKPAFMAEQESHFYAFGRFRLKTAERVLLREGEPVPLTPKVFDILLTLVEKGGHVVEKDDLMRRVWPSTFVEEGNLTQNVSLLRKALGESPSGPQFIETVPRRGYRFVANISEAWDDNIGQAVATTPTSSPDTQLVIKHANSPGVPAGVTTSPVPQTRFRTNLRRNLQATAHTLDFYCPASGKRVPLSS